MFAKTTTQLLALVLLCGQVAAQEPMPWWARISAEDTTGILEMCFKKTAAGVTPNNGDRCSRFAKVCFFGLQECPVVGPHPTLRCECDGLFARGATRTWSCEDEACPAVDGEGTTLPPPTTTAATTAAATTPAPDTTAAATTADATTEAGTTPAPDTTVGATTDDFPTEATTTPAPDTTVVATTTDPNTEAATTPAPDTTVAATTADATTEAATTPAPDTTVAATTAAATTVMASTTAAETDDAATTGIPDTTVPTTPGPCPADIPITGQTDGCVVDGRTCTYTSEATNATTKCTETDVCRCGVPSWTCEPTAVECEELPPVDCPAMLPTASDTCARADAVCTYTETSRNDTDVCEIVTPCTCDGSSYTCAAPTITCVDRPPRVCPETPPAPGVDSCAESGFICTYTQGSANDTSICNTTNVCTCGDDLLFGCAVPVVICEDAPDFTCPAAPDAGGPCTAPGRSCDYTINDQNETTTCTIDQRCTCGDDGLFACADPVIRECVDSMLPTCPEGTPSTDDTCEADGLVCTSIIESSNSTNVCNATTVCTCGADTLFDCAAPVVNCIEVDEAVCPEAKPTSGDTCGGPIGCAYTNSFSNTTDACTIEESCTCSENVFTCDAPTVACQPIPDCGLAPDPGGSCSLNGFQCTFTIPFANTTDTCFITTACTCDGSTYTCVDTDVTCDPLAYACPLSRPSEGMECTGGAGAACTFGGTFQNDTSTCNIVNTCTCSDSEVFGCVETSVECSDSPPLVCPGPEIPSSGSVPCSPNGLACTYLFSSATEPGCDDQTICSCGDGVFTCGASTVVCPT